MRKAWGTIIIIAAVVAVIGLLTFRPNWPPREETLVYRFKTDAPTLDPALGRDTTSSTVLQCVFDGLVEQDPITLAITPELAESWEMSEDGTVYTFHLRRNVKFHNGRQVTAEDFKYGMERVLHPATGADQRWVLEEIVGADEFDGETVKHVEGIEVLDSYTLRIRIKRPYAPFLSLLSMEAASPVPREEVERLGERFATQPMGCGPYKFVKWKRDASIVLERFDGYWGEAPKIKYIKFKVIPDDAVALEKYLHGDFDVLTELPVKRARELLKNRPTDTQLWDMLGVYYIAFNHTKPPFQGNRALRQAFSYAINREAICETILEGIPIPAHGVLPPGFASFDETLEAYAYDPEKAKALLAEAGYPNGEGLPTITLQFNTSESHEAVCEAIKNDLHDVGIEVELRNYEWATHLESMKNHEPPLFRAGWLADVPSEDNFLQLLATDRETNYSGYSNPAFDAAFEQARFSTDPDEQRRLYREANRIAVEDAAWIFLYWYRDMMMVKPYLKGWVLPIQGDFRMPLHRLHFTSPPGS